MDIKVATNKRTAEYTKLNHTYENAPYDYETNGILTKSLPKILFKGNRFLVTFLQLIDIRCVMLFKNIDKIKRFKWITWY